jgi:hypothetical protein
MRSAHSLRSSAKNSCHGKIRLIDGIGVGNGDRIDLGSSRRRQDGQADQHGQAGAKRAGYLHEIHHACSARVRVGEMLLLAAAIAKVAFPGLKL